MYSRDTKNPICRYSSASRLQPVEPRRNGLKKGMLPETLTWVQQLTIDIVRHFLLFLSWGLLENGNITLLCLQHLSKRGLCIVHRVDACIRSFIQCFTKQCGPLNNRLAKVAGRTPRIYLLLTKGLSKHIQLKWHNCLLFYFVIDLARNDAMWHWRKRKLTVCILQHGQNAQWPNVSIPC